MSDLTPMLVQYLVGLCCLQWDPDAVDVTIGDMVLDSASGKERDVDVTVTVATSDGVTHAFKTYEVKHEAAPLDVSVVEGLCLKLMDMPSVTHRTIASSSGFSNGARGKASRHGVSLLHLKPWSRRIEEQFPVLGMSGTIDECFPGATSLLCWTREQVDLVVEAGPDAFSIGAQDGVYCSDGTPHPKYATFGDFRNALLLRSTQLLYRLEPAATVLRTFPIPPVPPADSSTAGPAWPHTHTMDVSSDQVYLRIRNDVHLLEAATVSGHLQWQRGQRPQHYVLEDVENGSAFAGALIALEPGDGRMTALLFSPKTRDISIRFVRLAEKHKHAIRNLKLAAPSAR